MKNEKLLEKIGEISDDFISEANPIAKIKNKRPWIKWGALAACLTLAVLTVIKMIPSNPVEPELGGLPLLSITENLGESMGFEGYTAYDISEIVNNNPWTDATAISTLPVYQNPLTYDEKHQVSGADSDKVKELLLNVANRLGLDVDNLDITNNALDEKIADNGIKIEVDQQMTAKIEFDPAITLPKAYNFAYYTTYEQVAAVAEYLKEQYKDLIGMDNPQVNIYGGDYAIFSEEDIEFHGAQQAQGYSIEFYDVGGDLTSQIINYNFNRVAFYCDDDGKLFLARVFQPDLSGKLGDYPIINTDEAKELLKNGHYITTVPEEFPGLEYVARAELIYRTGGMEQYFMPYYRFYVELSDMQMESGLKTYGAYYVPAVEGKYLSNMPVWEGRFN